MGLFTKKTLKYGTASLILVAVVIAFIFVFNLVAGIVTDKLNLFVDLTSEELYTISDSTHKLLEGSMDTPVRIIFLTPLDKLDSNTYVKNIKTLALEYEEQFDNVSVEYIDMKSNPEQVRRYRKDYSLTETTVIVDSGKSFCAFDMSECFMYQNNNGNYTYYAFNGEYRFTSSIMRVTRDTFPVVSFVTNHGESPSEALINVFEESGFEVKKIDLLQEAIPQQTELLFMVAPITDITGTTSEDEGRSEVTKLSQYLSTGRDLVVFVDPNTPELPNLDEFLYTWGIDVIHGVSVQDNTNSFSSANNMALFTNYYTGDENTLPLVENMTQTSMRAVSYFTSPISIAPLTVKTRGASPLLTSYTSAFVPQNSQENLIENRQIPLLVAGYERNFNSDTGDTDRTYVVVGGSTNFVSDQFLDTYSVTFANSEFIRNLIASLTDEKIVLDVPYKVYNDTSLVANPKQTREWSVSLITVLPALVLLVSFGVFLKRRHL